MYVFKLLRKEDKINTFIHIIWKQNTKYRVFSDLHRIYVDKIFRREPILGKSGSVSREQIDIYINAFLSYLLNKRCQGEPLRCYALTEPN